MKNKNENENEPTDEPLVNKVQLITHSTVPLPDGIVIGGAWPFTRITWPSGNSRSLTRPEYDLWQALENTKREVDVFRSILNRICEITGDSKHTNENVVAGVERLKAERDAMKLHPHLERFRAWCGLNYVGLDYSMNWALSLLRCSSVTDWSDPIDYAAWVRNVAAAGAMGEDWRLCELEKQAQEQARNFPHRKKA